ncbi:MAG TPA: type IV pilus twitching motility protein PilT [Nitrospirota bacterium]|nr:type IV pilus twitching motility protein PilT [Nitrospirota bacterium]
MGQLDKLVERIQPTQELLLESQKEPTMRSASGLKIMVNQRLTSAQITALLAELAPADLKANFLQKKPASFEYSLGSKRYTVSYLTQGELVRGVISLSDAAEHDAPAEDTPGEDTVAVDMGAGDEEDVEVLSSQSEPEPARTKGGEPDVNSLLRKMFQLGASDLHLTAGHRPMIRLHGDMQELSKQQPLSAEQIKSLILPIMPPHNQSQFEEMHDTDFAHEISGLARFRVNVFRDRFGMGSVFRQIPMEIVTAEKLGLSKEVLDLCYLSKGLVLVTGPTGSGKSTTLCALIDYINRHRKDHIITIEDPIEFVHQRKLCLINQREVHIHTKSFSNALRAALREDPDIILVGEMRDLETISIAIETAETGHLVFGTLHTTTAASTVDRIIDQFPADRQAQIRAMLANSLKGVLAQTLCKRADGKGRVSAMEVLFVTSAVSNLIREGKIFQIPSVIQTSKGQGMIMLNDALFKLVGEGKVAPEEAYIKAVDKSGLLALLKTKNIDINISGMIE